MAEKGDDNSVKGNSAPVQIVRTGSDSIAHGILLGAVFILAVIAVLALFAFLSEAHGF